MGLQAADGAVMVCGSFFFSATRFHVALAHSYVEFNRSAGLPRF